MQGKGPPRRVLSKQLVHRAARYALAGGSLACGLAATFQTGEIAAIMAEDEEEVRRLGLRDLSSGLSLLTSQNLRPLLTRLRYDVGDSVTLLRKNPRLAPLAIAAVMLGVLAIFTRE